MLINKLNTCAAELYQVTPDFKRYNQKNNLMCRTLWDQEIMNLEEIRQVNLAKLVKTSAPGYNQFEIALLSSSLNYLDKIGFGINICDMKANAWQDKKGKTNAGMSSEDLTKALKKVAKMYGAAAVGIAELDRKWLYSHWFDLHTKESYPLLVSDETEDYGNINQPVLLENRTRIIPATMKTVMSITFENVTLKAY